MIKPHHYIEFKKNQKINFLIGKRAQHFQLRRTLPRVVTKYYIIKELHLQY